MTREFVDALGDLLTDYLGIVIDIESKADTGYKGIYSVKELRVMHMVFRYWRRGSPCTVTQVANETGISKTTVSRAVTTLMTNGLLKEENDPEDGRKRLLLPTEQGQQTLENVNAWLSLWADRLRDIMDRESTQIIAPEPVLPPSQTSADAVSR
ncbi:MAG: MarR family winged helix-turn-helix transcriptional regulator [Pseudomonadota bacterium]